MEMDSEENKYFLPAYEEVGWLSRSPRLELMIGIWSLGEKGKVRVKQAKTSLLV